MSEHLPNVRIGMVTGRQQIHISGTHGLLLETADGEQMAAIPAEAEVEARLLSGQAAEMVSYLRLAIQEDRAAAERQAQRLAAAEPGMSVHTVGITLPMGDFTLDNREHWVLVGPFASAEEAVAAQPSFGEVWDSSPVQLRRGQPSGAFAVNGYTLQEVLRVRPAAPEGRVVLRDVRVGIGFHWEHLEQQSYRGLLEIGIGLDGKLQAVNELSVEEYLASVNSSEMSADCHPDLLRAQTVAARSTVLATMAKHHHAETYHLCADDHCQCYHGQKAEQEASWEAVRESWGEVLVHSGRVCDARYSKICGGAIEDYRYVWDDRSIPYLVSGTDGSEPLDLPYDTEEKARAYIDDSPDVYCNTARYSIPEGQRHSRDLFRWEVTYTRQELEEIVREKSGRDVGRLLEIRPLHRGRSGRLVAIEIVGSRESFRVGKELAIRGVLSRSHLYSSCFYVVPTVDSKGDVTHFTLRGAGWGHGVGLCQIGATVMAAEGFSYHQILSHYYKGAELRRLW